MNMHVRKYAELVNEIHIKLTCVYKFNLNKVKILIK